MSKPWEPETFEERVREDYETMEKYAPKESLCDNCHFKVYHPAGSYYSVVEGGDDPYSYFYCAKDHWGGKEGPPPIKECDDFKKQETDYFQTAAELARKQVRKVKADKIIEFLRRPENA